MDDNGTPELLITLGVPEEWMRWINEAACECAKVKFVADLYIGSGNPHLTVEMSEDQREVLAMLGWYFFHNDPLKARRIAMAMAKQDIPHADGTVPTPPIGRV